MSQINNMSMSERILDLARNADYARVGCASEKFNIIIDSKNRCPSLILDSGSRKYGFSNHRLNNCASVQKNLTDNYKSFFIEGGGFEPVTIHFPIKTRNNQTSVDNGDDGSPLTDTEHKIAYTLNRIHEGKSVDREKFTLMLTGECFNQFVKLERTHPNELREFAEAIHKMQGLLAMRVARKVDSDNWPTYNIDDNGNWILQNEDEEDV